MAASPENRIRLLREVTERVARSPVPTGRACGCRPTAIRRASTIANPQAVFVPAAKALSEIGIAFLELREPGPEGTFGRTDVPKLSPPIREVFAGPLVLNSDYDSTDAAQAVLDSGVADAISFGRTFLANPDLAERLRAGAPLNPSNMRTWYSQGPEGYVDYPALERVDA